MTKPLQDQIAIVTGASRGIGAATAIALAAQGFGARQPETVTARHLDRTLDGLALHQIDSVNVLARAELQKLPLREAICASEALVQAVRKGLAASGEVAQLGLEILGLNILAFKPTPETARALSGGQNHIRL